MKAAIISTFLALFVALVAAQSNVPFYITSPLQGDSFKAGSTVELKWLNGVSGAAKVTLLTGTSASTLKPTGISFSIDGADNEYDWKVPSNLPQNATFSLQISYTDPTTKQAATTYSAPFTLTGTSGDVVTQSFVTGVSSAVASASSVISSAISSALPVTSASIPSVIRSNSAIPTSSASASASASASQAPTSAAVGFKAPTVAICVVAIIASALFL